MLTKKDKFNKHSKKLDVILTTNIENLGKAGETVKVVSGHFRNHLMPKLLAFPNVDRFAYLYIKIDTELRSPVDKDEIISEVARQLGVQIEPENLQLPSPLSTLGEFEVPLKLPTSLPLPEGKVHWTLDVKIRKN
ncbi:uncharacterized protein LOC143625117 [Bidens hawaiensis]|uniref:uncharacterized protein LOC143625117 n=1 Tax=Bidens hawaiensis TaxID=980011 RepID=UPI00404A4F3F